MNEVLISEFARNEADGDAAEGATLRPVLWSELTARLAAMRDLRQSLADGLRGHGANFSSLADAGLQICHSDTHCGDIRHKSVQDGARVNARAPDINRKALVDGKGSALNKPVEPHCVTPGDRELK